MARSPPFYPIIWEAHGLGWGWVDKFSEVRGLGPSVAASRWLEHKRTHKIIGLGFSNNCYLLAFRNLLLLVLLMLFPCFLALAVVVAVNPIFLLEFSTHLWR